MKYEYEKMSSDEIDELYYDVFADYFFQNINDHTDHRQEIIDCIESGVPQGILTSKTVGGWTEEDGIPGVDFVL